MDELLLDILEALRMLRASPSLAGVTILTLVCGIGLNAVAITTLRGMGASSPIEDRLQLIPASGTGLGLQLHWLSTRTEP